MPLQSSGAISLNDVQTEFGGSNPIGINEYYRGGSNVPDTSANSLIPTSGTIQLDDFYEGDSTPAPTYSVSPSSFSVNEGSSLDFTLTTSNVSGTVYWTISHGTTASADFSATSGSVTVSSNSTTITVTITADSTTEGSETFALQIRTGSTSGTVVATSGTVTISDTSTGSSYTPVIPTTNLYTHWDFSLLPGSSGSTLTQSSSGTIISNFSGTNAGASSNTPSLYVYSGSNTSYTVSIGTQNSLKCLVMGGSGSQYTFPEVKAITDAWTVPVNHDDEYAWAAVYSITSAHSSWRRPYMFWYTPYEYSGAYTFANSNGSNNLRVHHSGGTSPYRAFTNSYRDDVGLHVEMFSVIKYSSYLYYPNGIIWSSTNNTKYSVGGTVNFAPTLSHNTTASNRQLRLRDHDYWNGSPSMNFMEIAYWDQSFTGTEMTGIVDDLISKWS